MLKRIKMHKFYTETYWHDADVVIDVPDDTEEDEVRDALYEHFEGDDEIFPYEFAGADLEIDDVLDAPAGSVPALRLREQWCERCREDHLMAVTDRENGPPTCRRQRRSGVCRRGG